MNDFIPYVVGSIVWLADGKVALQALARGPRADCQRFADTAEHPLQPGDVPDPDRPARMLVISNTDWEAILSQLSRLDGRAIQ